MSENLMNPCLIRVSGVRSLSQELIHRYQELIVNQFDSVYDLTVHPERMEERKLYEPRKIAYTKELADKTPHT